MKECVFVFLHRKWEPEKKAEKKRDCEVRGATSSELLPVGQQHKAGDFGTILTACLLRAAGADVRSCKLSSPGCFIVDQAQELRRAEESSGLSRVDD